MSKIRVKCDCDAGDECPQGRCGSMRRCSVLRQDLDEASRVEVLEKRMDGLVLETASRFSDISENVKRRLSSLESHTGRNAMAESIDALEKREAQHDNYSQQRMDRLEKAIDQLRSDLVKNLQATDTTLKTQDRAIGILSDRLDYHNISLPQEASIKRVYKGGWVNVEHDNPGMPLRIIGLFKDKAKADACALTSRIACIQIPDITEGEGL